MHNVANNLHLPTYGTARYIATLFARVYSQKLVFKSNLRNMFFLTKCHIPLNKSSLFRTITQRLEENKLCTSAFMRNKNWFSTSEFQFADSKLCKGEFLRFSWIINGSEGDFPISLGKLESVMENISRAAKNKREKIKMRNNQRNIDADLMRNLITNRQKNKKLNKDI